MNSNCIHNLHIAIKIALQTIDDKKYLIGILVDMGIHFYYRICIQLSFFFALRAFDSPNELKNAI